VIEKKLGFCKNGKRIKREKILMGGRERERCAK